MVKPPSTDAASLKPLRAYIAAPADIDTTTLRRLLSDQNVAVDDAYSPSVGGPLTDTILKSIRSADCAVAIITQDSWTAYEVGLCDAFGKPVLVLATPEVQLPPFLGIHQHLRLQITDSDLLRLTLKKFVEEIRSGANRLTSRKSRPKKAIHSSPNVTELWAAIRAARADADSRSIEELAHHLLQSAAVTTVAQEPTTRDRGVDFAVWADSLAHVVGNPLMVEVKAGHLTINQLKNAELQLAAGMRSAGARLGLLLYLDREGRRFDQIRWDTPYVLRFDLEDFARALKQKPFANIIVEKRNRLVHGID